MPKAVLVDTHTILGSVTPPTLEVQSAIFEGTLGMLLRLVQDKKIDLLDVPLFPVACSYLEYLAESECTDLDHAGSSLLVLAYLIERKANGLLPQAEITIPEDLLTLIEPSGFLYAPLVDELEERHSDRQRLFFRNPDAPQEEYQLPVQFGELNIADLALAIQRILEKAIPAENDHTPNRPAFSLSHKMDEIIQLASKSIVPLRFESLLTTNYTRMEVVWVFLALLELLKLGVLEAHIQDESLFLEKKRMDEKVGAVSE